MSYALDLNILLYATTGNPLQERAIAFLQGCAARSEPLCLSWATIMGYLRLTTGKVLLNVPLSPAAALENIEALLRLPHARVLAERDGFLDDVCNPFDGA
jgi:predicted nucleic acid-binding protein